MMKETTQRKLMTIGRNINQSINLIDKESKIKKWTIDMQQQQKSKAFGQLQNKVSDPGRQRSKDT